MLDFGVIMFCKLCIEYYNNDDNNDGSNSS